jgi:hypothetical protein
MFHARFVSGMADFDTRSKLPSGRRASHGHERCFGDRTDD